MGVRPLWRIPDRVPACPRARARAKPSRAVRSPAQEARVLLQQQIRKMTVVTPVTRLRFLYSTALSPSGAPSVLASRVAWRQGEIPDPNFEA